MTVPLWVGVIGFAMILTQIWVVPIGVVIHVAAALITRSDSHFFTYFLKAFHARRRLEP
jgi:type IV secretory pathway VirB3-like protein